MDLNAKLEEIKKSIKEMTPDELDAMLEKAGAGLINPSVQSGYVKGLRRDFFESSRDYSVKRTYFKDMAKKERLTIYDAEYLKEVA